ARSAPTRPRRSLGPGYSRPASRRRQIRASPSSRATSTSVRGRDRSDVGPDPRGLSPGGTPLPSLRAERQAAEDPVRDGAPGRRVADAGVAAPPPARAPARPRLRGAEVGRVAPGAAGPRRRLPGDRVPAAAGDGRLGLGRARRVASPEHRLPPLPRAAFPGRDAPAHARGAQGSARDPEPRSRRQALRRAGRRRPQAIAAAARDLPRAAEPRRGFPRRAEPGRAPARAPPADRDDARRLPARGEAA